jgi:hypothetical protein
VSPKFRTAIIKEYLLFILQLGWRPSEICFRTGAVQGLDVWRNLFSSRLRSIFAGRDYLHWMPLQEAMSSLDMGKGYVAEGYDWLKQEVSKTTG